MSKYNCVRHVYMSDRPCPKCEEQKENVANLLAAELERTYHAVLCKFPELGNGDVAKVNAIGFYEFVHRVS